MSTFVISKRYNGDYKFVFASRKGKTIFTSIACKHKSDCESMILGIKENIAFFAFTKVRKAKAMPDNRKKKTKSYILNKNI